ncbi:hypothetical protein EW146_g6141 [Bondarzewia mesenterica]|uniref:ABC transporter domain-containing protein n=1 Tax=Bondarzewia mesenterica TaxID=1095465 RepID=A0A4S4LRI3_9AGAM|nr:hypothetical protein EW146_g6141 [Bondarzewia mesenterica]
MLFCPAATAVQFSNPCIRTFWSTFLPAVLVILFAVASIPIPTRVRKLTRAFTTPFRHFLTLPEAEALDAAAAAGDTVAGDEDVNVYGKTPAVPLWKTLVFSWIALLESLTWLAVGSYIAFQGSEVVLDIVHAFVAAVAWLYAAIRPVVRPQPTPPFDLFSLYFLNLALEIYNFGGIIYDLKILDLPLPSPLIIVAHVLNLVAILVLLLVILDMPLAVPSKRVDKEQIGASITPEDYTTLWGWITFSWVWPLIKRGTNITLNEGDVWGMSPTLQSRPVFIKFSWIKRNTLLRRLWAANSLDIMLDFALTYLSVVFNYASPFFLKRILDAIDHPTPENRSQAYIYAVLAFLCTVAKAQADVQHLWFGRRACTRIRSELMASIYDKALKRKDFSGIIDKDNIKKASEPGAKKGKEDEKADDPKAGADVGKIVNLMAGDANRIAQMVSGAYFIYGAPFEILIASIFLYQLLGLSAFAGFGVLILGWPLNSFIMRRSIRIQKGVMAARDKRMGVLNELIGAVKFIKFFAWEDRWIERALDAREVEMNWMVKARVNSVMFSMLWTCAPILVSVISFFTFVMQGKQLTVSIAFTAIALFNMIRAPLNVIPAWIVQILQTGVALNRISVYLDEDEVDEQVSSLKKSRSGPNAASDTDKGLGLENASFKWNEIEEKKEDTDAKDAKKNNGQLNETDTSGDADSRQSIDIGAGEHRFELRDISIMFPEGQLTVITGPTASGKTALLMALLGEMTMLPGGRIIMSKDSSIVDENGLTHTISYAAQSPWLRHQSIKENILFGYPFDQERYNAVVECCALNPDLEILEDGDETEIGARGVSLSGGQKARVALARAVYAPAKYVLLDDPLSAVDSHTARFLFDKLFKGPLLANRTVILVTHHVELVLPGTHYLVRMLDGRIDTQGTVSDLRAQGVLDDIAQESEVQAHEEEQVLFKSEPTPEEEAVEAAGEEEEAKPATETKKPRRLVKDEQRQSGGVKWSIYKTYLKASSYWTWFILTVLIFATQFLGVTEKVWIKIWGEAYGDASAPSSPASFMSFSAIEHETMMDGPLGPHHLSHAVHSMHAGALPHTLLTLPSANDDPLFYISIYAAIGLGTALVYVMAVVTQYTGALRASRVLFKRLLETVVRATMRWHDTTPQGRMLNRFSKDVETVDSSLASSLQAVNSSLATFAASAITVAVVFPGFLIPAFFIGLAYRQLAIGYLNTGRDLRRMESNTRSPIFSGFGELLEGIVTVRAFSAEQSFLDGLHAKIDLTTQMWYGFWMMNRWLLLNFDTLGAFAVFVTTLFSLSGYVKAGTAGLCITSAMAFTTSVYWACRFWTALELDLNSVERVVEYLDLPQEPPAIIESSRPPAYWPSSEGNDLIVVEDLVIKYAPELPPVLHNVSFSLKARERIGLLGRTGKEWQINFGNEYSAVDPASGRILVDGIDISKIGLHDLRSRVTFIPQDATLFSGTLRENLDPFSKRPTSSFPRASAHESHR